jgi:soluble lytic murein transglycosylase
MSAPRRDKDRTDPGTACYLLAMRGLPVLLLLTLAGPAAAQPWASAPERAAGRAALAAANAGRLAEAETLAVSADPMLRRIVTWLRLQRPNEASAEEILAFVAAYPDWPFRETLLRRAEEVATEDAAALRLAGHGVLRTLAAAQRVTEALLRAGRSQEAAETLRAAWISAPGDAQAEAAILAAHRDRLRAEDHLARFERRASARDAAAAQRLVALLPGSARGAAALRLQFLAESGDPAAARAIRDPGVLTEAARLARRREADGLAAELWRRATPLQAALGEDALRALWAERQLLARRLLRLGEPRLAYELAAGHGLERTDGMRAEAEFLAGFIALRVLNDASLAARHFAEIERSGPAVITTSRGAYWLGRAALARGDAGAARGHFARAADRPTAFYGQLAARELGEGLPALARRLSRAAPPEPDPARLAAFAGRDLVRAAETLYDLGDPRRALSFLLRLEDLAADATDRLKIARFARALGREDHAVWVARRAGAQGAMIVPDGWPAPYPPPRGVLEPALVLAISRQESNFDTLAVSSARAMGVMQLLPTTAQQVARRLGIRHATPMLTQDPAHNMLLGAHYAAEMLGRFGGHPVLAAAAYNAGPARVDQWLTTYGDPRAGTDLLDWMEQIPFAETRNYVQRVMENVAVYRALDPRTAALGHPLDRLLAAGR